MKAVEEHFNTQVPYTIERETTLPPSFSLVGKIFPPSEQSFPSIPLTIKLTSLLYFTYDPTILYFDPSPIYDPLF
jgi:hypothetical protein